jgi:mono/diheme cytochrome c family protein
VRRDPQRARLAAGILIGLAGAGVVALAGTLALFHAGIGARPAPSALETIVARRARHLLVPRAMRDMPNPLPRTEEALRAGREHWADHCAICHGNDGRGDTAIGNGTYPRAPDMRLAATQRLTDGELFYIIENGVRFTAMPAWGTGDPSPTSESWNLVHFIRHLPELGPGEIAEMERLNPKTARERQDEEESRRFLNGGEAPAATADHCP